MFPDNCWVPCFTTDIIIILKNGTYKQFLYIIAPNNIVSLSHQQFVTKYSINVVFVGIQQWLQWTNH